MKRLLLWVLVTAFLILTGCSGFVSQNKAQEKIISNSQAYNSNKNFPDEIPPLKPIQGETNKPGQPTTAPTTKPTLTPKATPPPGGYDWLMSVDDNVTMNIQGMKWHMNLYVSMTKSGGKDLIGEFSGKILLTSEMEQTSMKKTFEENTDMIFDGGNANMTIEAVKATITVVKYDSKAYKEFAGSFGGGTLPKSADYMAVGTIDMKTRFQSNQWGHDSTGEGAGWVPDQEMTSPVPVKFLITGSQVTAYVGFGGDQPFKGMVTGRLN